MTELRSILSTPGQGEHLGEDGLIHCDRCGGARQVRLPLGDRPQTVRCLCPCQQAQMDSQRQQLRRQEELDRFSRLRSAAMRDPALRKCTFAASGYPSTAMEIAENYVARWPRMQEKGMGLLFWGPPGSGKTYLASCIANALLDQSVPVLMTSFGRLLGAMPGPASGEQTAALDEWMRYPLLIVDDLGVERDTPYTTEQVYHIIDARYRSGMPMVITTNLTVAELKNPDSIEKMRIYDRVLECCIPVRVEGTHIRGEKRDENMAFARKHLK